MLLMRSRCFVVIRINIFNNLAGKHLAPKAEARGSNSFGCANLFNDLDVDLYCQKVPVRIMSG